MKAWKKHILLLGVCAWTCIGCQSQDVSKQPVQEPIEKPKVEDIRVSFAAVGDNLIHGAVYYDPMHRFDMDYRSVYDPVKPYLQGVDVKNINQETVLGGKELGLSHYPLFNGPQEIGEAVVEAGFNWISQASNHAMDAGEKAILNQLSLWDRYDHVIATGMNRSQEEKDRPRILTVRGMKIGLLNYTYGLNGLVTPQGKEYLINIIHEDAIKEDIAKLKSNCDVIIASMHWGVEYAYVPNEEQKQLAQLLNEQGVDVIIGSHPHVLEPAEFLTNKEGKKTLVYYSLGNFLSAQDRGDTMLGGMAKWEIVKDGTDGSIRIEHACLYPTVTQYNHDLADFKVYLLKDYNDDLASSHYLSQTISKQYLIDLTNQIMESVEGIDIIY